MQTQQLLRENFAERKVAHTNRASSVFPVLIRPNGDTSLVFLNYWQIKNRLDPVTMVVRIYNATGELAYRGSQRVTEPHNEISLRELLQTDRFDGLVEIEILSTQNLVFHFPAVMVFYRSGNHFSTVHAGGRVRNADEPIVPRWSWETNWPCRPTENISPCVHLFNGPRQGGMAGIEMRLMANGSKVLQSREADWGIDAPFSSRLVMLDEVFDLQEFAGIDYFMAIKTPHAECFPRLVVGNYHHDIDFLEATHSFYWTTNNDYLPTDNPAIPLPAFIPAMNPPGLNLELISFPTNAPAEVTGTIRSALAGAALQETGQSLQWQTGGDNAPVWRHSLPPDEEFQCIDLRQGQIPTRLNTTFRHTVRGAPPRFSTNVAWGAYACTYPQRRSHWGHGVLSPEYETVIMIRNVAHRAGESADAPAELTVYGMAGNADTLQVNIPAESVRYIRLREWIGAPLGEHFVSWFLRSENPCLDTFWLSYAPDGSICGDHGF